MYELKLYRLKEVPIFSLADVSQIASGKEYAKKLLKKMRDGGEIKRIKRDIYTFHEDPLLVSTFLVKPSYISSASALSFHKMITQIPVNTFCCTTKSKKQFKYISKIRFIHTNYFFGFEIQDYLGFKIPIATPEKAIIDSLGVIPISIFDEAIGLINSDLLISYLKKIKKSSIIKRIGYLLEKNKINAYELKKYVNNKYIYLDPLGKKEGKKNKEWKIMINTK